jgi:hypothetical protein
MVRQTAEGHVINAVGHVERLRMGDGGAWIALDQRQGDSAVHPFPADDRRGTHVLAFPEDCDPEAPALRVVRPAP